MVKALGSHSDFFNTWTSRRLATDFRLWALETARSTLRFCREMNQFGMAQDLARASI
jgi:hypothetical protein